MGSNSRNVQRQFLLPLNVTFLLCVAATAVPAQVSSQTTQTQVRADSTLYLFDLHAEDAVLAESIPAYALDDTYFIEIGEFFRGIEFIIERHGTVWSGWFFDESSEFTWQMNTGAVEISGLDAEPVERDSWFELENETFVKASLLERWFGLELATDPRQQILTVGSNRSLPFQLWRERTLARYRHRISRKIEPDVVVPDQYNWVTQPLVNFDSTLVTRDDQGLRTASSATSITAGMDLLRHSVVFSGNYSRRGGNATDASESTRRLTVRRFSDTPFTPIFGDVHSYAFGDIYQTAPNLITSTNVGRGFTINRYAKTRASNLSTATIANDAPPGWEVELYRNGTLIDFGTVSPDGRYRFADQGIQFGENVFVARVYGPQGQVREDTQIFFGGGIDLAPGDYDYSISHIDFSEYLLDGHRDFHSALTANHATEFRYSRALSGDVEVGGGFTRTGVGTRERDGTFVDRNYLTVFGRARLGPGVLVGEAVDQLDAGQAVSLEYLAGLGGRTYSFVQRIFNDYESPATLQAEALHAYTEISTLGFFGTGTRSGYRAGIRRRQLREGGSDLRLFSRIGTRLGPISLTSELEHRADFDDDSTVGLVRVAGRIGTMNIRGQVDYEFGGQTPIRQVAVSMNWDLSPRLNNNLTVSRNFTTTSSGFLTNMLSVRIRDFDLSLGASTDFDREWSIAAGVSFSFGYDNRQQSFVTDFRGLANTGRVTLNLFLDRNGNGVRDPGEPPIERATYRDQAMTSANTGSLTLTAQPGETAIHIETKNFSFDDPFLAPSLGVYEVRTHAGGDMDLDIAIVMTGDIEGNVYTTAGEPARGLTVTLRDSNRNEIGISRSEFDGYFSFSGVPGGDYTIVVVNEAGQMVTPQPVTLDVDRGYVIADDITLSAATTETSR